MKSETKKNLAELKSLATSAKLNIYRRLKLASEIMSDPDWITSEFDGDASKSEVHLGSEYCSDLVLIISMHKLLLIFNAFPEQHTWSGNHYDLRLMDHLYQKSIKQDKPVKSTTNWKPIAQEEIQKRKLVEREKEDQSSEIAALKKQVRKLERRVSDLTVRNATLCGRMKQMETFTT